MKPNTSLRAIRRALLPVFLVSLSVFCSHVNAATISFPTITSYQGRNVDENPNGSWEYDLRSTSLLSKADAVQWTRDRHTVELMEIYDDGNGRSYYSHVQHDEIFTTGENGPNDCDFWEAHGPGAILVPQSEAIFIYVSTAGGTPPPDPANVVAVCRFDSGLRVGIWTVPAMEVRAAGPICPERYSRLGGMCVWNNGLPLPTKNLGGDRCEILAGNPINVATGNKYQRENDINASGNSTLEFVRHYNSGLERSGSIGANWSHSYRKSVFRENNSVIVRRENGSEYFFVRQSSGEWITDSDIIARLTETQTGWLYVDENDNTEEFSSEGRLSSITDRAGKTLTFSYDNEDRLETVTDNFGKTLTFFYDDRHRINEIVAPDSTIYQYDYDINGNLRSVTYPDITTENLSDNPIRIYHYEDPAHTNHLTGITDENGLRYASWSYDFRHGRAISSEHENSAERVDIAYSHDPSSTLLTSTVSNAQGEEHIYSFNRSLGVAKTSQISGNACATCGGDAQAITYDANGFVTSRTDFNGNVTNFTRDSRGLELTRTEAFGTPEQRTITTTWHPNFRLPTEIIEPNKTTIFTYDTNGNLLSRSETDTRP